jgi:antitoxin component YwqK of YwqJK toxin-antitoxin module
MVYQPVEYKDGKNILKTIIVDTESDEVLESSIALPDNLEPQKMGSAITYLRRYSLQSMLFLQAEDDDANVSSPKNTTLKQYIGGTITPKTKTIQNPANDLPFN